MTPTATTTRIFYVCFIAINTLLAAYFLDSIPSPNPTSRVLPVLTLYEEGSYIIDTYEQTTMDKSFIKGHYYSDKAPLTTWIVIPVYGVFRQLGLTGSDHIANTPLTDASFYHRWLPVAFVGAFLCGTLPFVALAWLILRRIVKEAPGTNPVFVCMLPLYGSFVFAYSGVFIGHLLAGILLCGSYALLKEHKQPALCGLLLGLAVLAEFPAALAVPVWTVVIARTDRRKLAPFIAGGLPCLLALFLYNHSITGSFATMPYDYIADDAFAEMRSMYGLRLPQLEAVWGLLFSTYRGMLFYAPAFVVIAWAYVTTRRSRILSEDLRTPLAVLTIGYVAMISSYFVWWGGWAYGPRHLIPVAMLLFYEGIPMIARHTRLRTLLYCASAFGILSVWIAKSTVLHIMPETFSNPIFDLALPKFIHGDLRLDSILTRAFGFHPLVASLTWVVLFLAGVTRLHAMHARMFSTGEPVSKLTPSCVVP